MEEYVSTTWKELKSSLKSKRLTSKLQWIVVGDEYQIYLFDEQLKLTTSISITNPKNGDQFDFETNYKEISNRVLSPFGSEATTKIFYEDEINAGIEDKKQTPIVTNNKIVRIVELGWSCASNDIAIFQWGDDLGGWETIRGGYGNMSFSNLFKDFIGDGVKRFQIIRNNNGGSPRPIIVWFEIVELGD